MAEIKRFPNDSAANFTIVHRARQEARLMALRLREHAIWWSNPPDDSNDLDYQQELNFYYHPRAARHLALTYGDAIPNLLTMSILCLLEYEIQWDEKDELSEKLGLELEKDND